MTLVVLSEPGEVKEAAASVETERDLSIILAQIIFTTETSPHPRSSGC